MLYFMDAHGKEIKVGYTHEDRLDGDRLSSHKRNGLEPIAVMRGDRADERELKKALREFVIRGEEWLTPDPRIWDYIDWLVRNRYAVVDDNVSNLPSIPQHVWMYRKDLPYKQDHNGQLDIFGALSPKERLKRFAAVAYHHSFTDDWYTERQWVERARRTMGSIDLDPATCAGTNALFIKAPTFYTKEVDGLSRHLPWFGNVWLNPPYGDLAKRFFVRMRDEYEAGNIISCVTCCSINAMTSIWFHETVGRVASGFYIHRGRIDFLKAGTLTKGDAVNQGTLIAYVGSDVDSFRMAFADAGGFVITR